MVLATGHPCVFLERGVARCAYGLGHDFLQCGTRCPLIFRRLGCAGDTHGLVLSPSSPVLTAGDPHDVPSALHAPDRGPYGHGRTLEARQGAATAQRFDHFDDAPRTRLACDQVLYGVRCPVTSRTGRAALSRRLGRSAVCPSLLDRCIRHRGGWGGYCQRIDLSQSGAERLHPFVYTCFFRLNRGERLAEVVRRLDETGGDGRIC